MRHAIRSSSFRKSTKLKSTFQEASPALHPRLADRDRAGDDGEIETFSLRTILAVSYTHLTLPTIYSV